MNHIETLEARRLEERLYSSNALRNFVAIEVDGDRVILDRADVEAILEKLNAPSRCWECPDNDDDI